MGEVSPVFMSILSSSASFPHWRPAVLALLALACLCFGSAVFAQEAHAPAGATVHALAEDASPGDKVAAAEHHGAEGLPAASPVVFQIGPLPVTSSMILTWIITIGIIAFAQYATRQIKQVPDGAQNFWEWLVESLRNFLEGVIGRVLVKETFWFFATIFIFILFTNWFGLIPGVGTIGWGIPDAHGQLTHISRPLLRGTNADLNMTAAMSLIFFACWIFWAIKSNGFGGALLHIFGPKGETHGAMKVFMICIFAVVGVLEVVSIAMRPVSLSFRLYGNVFAGENMLEAMANLIPSLAWLIPIPFYFMELLVGIVQALVFMLLTAVFTLLICSHGDEPHHEGAHH
jgi:F-type H+-transporting ATPase subunit a